MKAINLFCCSAEYHCLQSDWRCAEEKCIRKGFVCDGYENCANGSDERNCRKLVVIVIVVVVVVTVTAWAFDV